MKDIELCNLKCNVGLLECSSMDAYDVGSTQVDISGVHARARQIQATNVILFFEVYKAQSGVTAN